MLWPMLWPIFCGFGCLGNHPRYRPSAASVSPLVVM